MEVEDRLSLVNLTEDEAEVIYTAAGLLLQILKNNNNKEAFYSSINIDNDVYSIAFHKCAKKKNK